MLRCLQNKNKICSLVFNGKNKKITIYILYTLLIFFKIKNKESFKFNMRLSHHYVYDRSMIE